MLKCRDVISARRYYLLHDAFSNFVFSTWTVLNIREARCALLFILSVLVLIPKGFASLCIGNKCLCVEQISLIDCSGAGLESIPQTKKRMVNYTTLSLRDNLLLEVNFTWLMEQFPDLKTVDLRNNPIHCEGINSGGPLKVITNCKTSKPTTHHRITAKIIS